MSNSASRKRIRPKPLDTTAARVSDSEARLSPEFNSDLDEARPEEKITHFSLLTSAQRALLPDATQPLAAEWHGSIQQRFSEQARRVPDRIAVKDAYGCWRYRELDQLSTQLAGYLRAGGIKREDLVAIYAHRSAALVWAMLATLKSGAGFVILDPAYPAARLIETLRVAQPRAWLQLAAAGALPEALADFVATSAYSCHLELPASLSEAQQVRMEPLSDDAAFMVEPDDLAYIAFTSGSTGLPKGVLGTHRPLSHFLHWHTNNFKLHQHDRFSMLSGLSHDPLLRDILTPLWLGATLCIPDGELMGSPGWLKQWLIQNGITVAHLTPAMGQLLLTPANDHTETADVLRYLFFGGDVLTTRDVLSLNDFAESAQIVNFYGTTETPQAMSYYLVDTHEARQGNRTRVPVGRGIAGVQLLVLSAGEELAGVGDVGEIYVRTPYLARGYKDDETLTRERFKTNPITQVEGDRLYRTGDIGRYLPSGDVEYLGRADQQVKLRGYRIELGEIEWALHQHPQISEVVVVLREEQLVAYVVGVDERVISSTELRQFLRVKVPDYMVPARFVQLERLPLTANGKVDRRALQELAVESAGGGELVLARTPVEEILSGIWAEVLGCETVSVYDSFLELGGHSLLATQVISRIRDVFGQELTLRTLLENPTVASLARTIEGGQSIVSGPKTPPIVRIESTGRAPASFAQQSLWLLHQLEPGKVFSNFPAVSTLTGTLNFEALVGALTAMTQRHEVLRTTFTSVDGELWQIISPAESFDLPLVDLSEIPDKARETETRRLISKEAGQPFDLARGPLMRGKLLRLSAEEHVALLTIHPIVLDLWSISIFLREVAALYRAFHEGQPSPLGALQVQYADFAHWQQQWFQGQVFEQQLHYWRQQLAGAPAALELKGKKPTPTVVTFRAANHPIELSKELAKKLRELGRQTGVTLFMSLLAAFDVLLYRYSGQSDLLVGTRIANRNQLETEGLIGFFIDTLVLRIDLSGDPTFIEVLQRVREVCLEAYAHQELPFVKLVEELQPDRSQSHSPLFQVMFIMGYQGIDKLELPGLSWSVHLIQNRTAKVDLLLSLWETNDGMGGYFKYNTDIFDDSTIAKMVKHFQTLIENLVTDPQQHLSDSSFLTEDETMGLTSADFPESGLSQKDFESLILQLNSSSSLK